MYKRKIALPLHCGLTITKEVLGGKYKSALIYAISLDIKRPSELVKALPDVTKRTLNMQLNELENLGIVSKKIYPRLPPKVEYSLTELGLTLLPIISAMIQWGDKNKRAMSKLIEARDNQIDAAK